MPLLRLIAVALLISSSTALLGLGAIAAPLDKEACANLEGERKKLLTPEVQAALERGPDWVKNHLDHEKIERVRQFLIVEESIVFRCRGGGVAKPVPVIVPLPDRKPVLPALPVKLPESGPNQTVADSEKAGEEAGPSQTVADSDKTAPSKSKATR